MIKNSILLVLLFLTGCGFVKEERIIGNYFLIANDEKDDMHIGYLLDGGNYIGIVPPKIYAISHNEKYIFAKEYPHFYPDKSDHLSSDFYIIPISYEPTLNPERGLIGPLNSSAFEDTVLAMGIAPVKFKVLEE